MGAVISYLKSVESPTSEEAHKVIDGVLEKHNCESPDGRIVAGGKQGAAPHEMGSGNIARNVSIVLDIYPRSRLTGYYADMSRTVCLGTPAPELQKMYDTVLAAQELALGLIRPQARCVEIQNAVDKFFEQEGYLTSGKGEHFPYLEGFVHGVGHGVGLKIHESPRIGRDSADILQEGDIVTVEPGLYYPQIGGVRIEDMVLVTRDGMENLTNFPKQFRI